MYVELHREDNRDPGVSKVSGSGQFLPLKKAERLATVNKFELGRYNG